MARIYPLPHCLTRWRKRFTSRLDSFLYPVGCSRAVPLYWVKKPSPSVYVGLCKSILPRLALFYAGRRQSVLMMLWQQLHYIFGNINNNDLLVAHTSCCRSFLGADCGVTSLCSESKHYRYPQCAKLSLHPNPTRWWSGHRNRFSRIAACSWLRGVGYVVAAHCCRRSGDVGRPNWLYG
ncbi:hypothetical protein D3C87_1406530 [compost metagenome]